MNDVQKEKIINDFAKFAISCSEAKQSKRAKNSEETLRLFFGKNFKTTLVKYDSKQNIQAIATYQIEVVNGENFLVFTSFFTRNKDFTTHSFLRQGMRKIKKEFGFDGVGFFNDQLKIKWI